MENKLKKYTPEFYLLYRKTVWILSSESNKNFFKAFFDRTNILLARISFQSLWLCIAIYCFSFSLYLSDSRIQSWQIELLSMIWFYKNVLYLWIFLLFFSSINFLISQITSWKTNKNILSIIIRCILYSPIFIRCILIIRRAIH